MLLLPVRCLPTANRHACRVRASLPAAVLAAARSEPLPKVTPPADKGLITAMALFARMKAKRQQQQPVTGEPGGVVAVVMAGAGGLPEQEPPAQQAQHAEAEAQQAQHAQQGKAAELGPAPLASTPRAKGMGQQQSLKPMASPFASPAVQAHSDPISGGKAEGGQGEGAEEGQGQAAEGGHGMSTDGLQGGEKTREERLGEKGGPAKEGGMDVGGEGEEEDGDLEIVSEPEVRAPTTAERKV